MGFNTIYKENKLIMKRQIIRLSEKEIGRIVSESIKKCLKENKLVNALEGDMAEFVRNNKGDVYDFIDQVAFPKYGIDEDRFYRSGFYQDWCELTGEDINNYHI